MLEKRAFKRLTTEGEVVIKPKDGTSRVIATDLVDVSFIGFGVSSKEQIEIEKSVDIELKANFGMSP